MRRYIPLVRIAFGFVVALLLAVGAVGCSSGSDQADPQPGTLPAGTANITVNGNDLGQFESVQCVPAGYLTTITTGDETAGTTAVVAGGDELSAQLVSINNLGGFTGSFNQNLGGEAKVTMTGPTYTITGNADGFQTDNPSFRTNGTFTIKVSC
jgi:ipoprotein LpqH